ncbi:MAG: flippase [Patescibacteria group bacterium]
MSLTRKIAHNMIYQMLGRGGGGILALVGVALITRYLGREGFGIYTTITAFLMFFGIIINFGLNTITVQMISETDEKIEEKMGNILALRLISSVIFLGLAPVISLFFPYPAVIKIGIALTSFAFLFQMLTEILIGIFQKYLQTWKPAFAEFASRVVFIVLVLLAIYFKMGILAMMMALNLANLAMFLLTLYYATKLIKIRLIFNWTEWTKILKRAWPIGISIILNLIYLKTDILILSVYKTQGEVGLYGAPYKLIDAITTFAMMFMGLVLPLLASAWAKQDKERFAKVFQKTFNLLIIIIIPMVVGTYFIAEKLMVFISGAEFAPSGKILSILVLGAGALFLGSLFAHSIVAIDRQRKIIWGYAIDAAISLAAYFIFIPKYSYIGAAWVTVFSEALIAAISLWIIYKYAKVAPKWIKIFAKSLAATVPMALVLYFFRGLGAFALMAIAVGVYGFFIILFKGITRNEVREIFKLKS